MFSETTNEPVKPSTTVTTGPLYVGGCITVIAGYLGLVAESSGGWDNVSLILLYSAVLGFYAMEVFSIAAKKVYTKVLKNVDDLFSAITEEDFKSRIGEHKTLCRALSDRKGQNWNGLGGKCRELCDAAAQEQSWLWYGGLWVVLGLMTWSAHKWNRDWLWEGKITVGAWSAFPILVIANKVRVLTDFWKLTWLPKWFRKLTWWLRKLFRKCFRKLTWCLRKWFRKWFTKENTKAHCQPKGKDIADGRN